jgi:hypothetical protein
MAKPRPSFVLGGLAIALAAIAWLKLTTPPPTAAERLAAAKGSGTFEQLDLAAAVCKNAAMNVLKSPSTARFLDDSTYKEDLGKGRSEIQLHVDAQNSFGAMMRTTIDCKTANVKGQTRVTAINSWQR